METSEPVLPRPVRNVCVVVTQLGRGGAETQTVELLRLLTESPWRPVRVVCLSSDLVPHGDAIQTLGYPLEVLERGGSFDVGRLARLRWLLLRDRIDLVHAVHLLASGYSFLSTRAARGPAVLPSVRGTVVEPGAIRSAVYRWMFRSCRRALVNSHRGAAFAQAKFRVPPGRIAVVPNGIDFARLKARSLETDLRRELGISPSASVVAYVGKRSTVKNIPRFLATWRAVSEHAPDTHAVLVGGGLGPGDRDELLGGCPRERTHFLGPRDDVPSVIAGSDVLVLTSNSEGSPNVVLEALAVGTPVVSTDVGDVRRMVEHGRTGFVEEDGSPENLARAVSRVLDQRATFREAIESDRGRLEREYSLSAMAAGTVRLWEEICTTATGG